jgi:hypothetical protein
VTLSTPFNQETQSQGHLAWREFHYLGGVKAPRDMQNEYVKLLTTQGGVWERGYTNNALIVWKSRERFSKSIFC